jgi:rhodanese-related sulfurtransferase
MIGNAVGMAARPSLAVGKCQALPTTWQKPTAWWPAHHSTLSTAGDSLECVTPAADPDQAREHFRSRLAYETDPADLHAELARGDASLVVIDARSAEAYAQEHIPGAISLPWREISASAVASLPDDRLLVTYCWGPGCNAATKAAAELATHGLRVKEMIGGIEYWKREGFDVA